jgi:hypothetical protein
VDAAPATPPRRKTLPLLLALSLLAGLTSGAWNIALSNDLNEAEEQNVQLFARVTVASRQPSAGPLLAENKALHDRISELENQLGQLGVPGYGPAATPQKSPFAQIASDMQSAGMRDLVTAQQQHAVDMIYGELFKHFQLSPEEHDRLQKLLVEKQLNQVDFGMKMMDANLSPSQRAQLAQQLSAANAATDAKIQEYFNNSDAYAYYQTYVQQQPERLELGTLSASLASANQPLDPAQADALLNLMYQERTNFKFSQDFYDQTKINPASVTGPAADTFLQEQERLQNQIAARAAAILSPEQLAAFRDNQVTIRQMMQSNLNLARQLAAGGP